MIQNRVQHSKLIGGIYPQTNGTKLFAIEAGSMGFVKDSSFTKDGLLQLSVLFNEDEVLVPYYMLVMLPFQEVKNGK